MNDIPEERCSCNARLKYKCCKESVLGGGKMCVRELKEEAVPIPRELIARMNAVQDKAEINKSKDSDIFMLLCYLDRALHFMESLEHKGVKMRTEKQNLEFLIDGIGEWVGVSDGVA